MSDDNIYCSLPEEINVSVDATKKEYLKNFLQDHAGKFFSSTELTKIAGFKGSNTNVELRKAVTQLIEIEMCPIVANSKGFAWASCSNMVKFYSQQLNERLLGLQRRINAVRKVYNQMSHEDEMSEEDWIDEIYEEERYNAVRK